MQKEDFSVTAKQICKLEDMDSHQLAEYIFDLIHRTAVHHTLWFREVEHQLGFERALAAMDEAWSKTRAIAVQRFSQELEFSETDGFPDALLSLPREKQLRLINAIAKNWLAQDGIWFQSVEKAYGMNDAKRCNDSTWARFSPFEAHAIKNLLGLSDRPGLDGLERALNFRIYGRLNRQSCRRENDALIFEMNDCRVQSARVRKGLADYPCKSAGLVEYARFAEAIDDRIRTECIGCPPGIHPPEWFCAWRFTINE